MHDIFQRGAPFFDKNLCKIFSFDQKFSRMLFFVKTHTSAHSTFSQY